MPVLIKVEKSNINGIEGRYKVLTESLLKITKCKYIWHNNWLSILSILYSIYVPVDVGAWTLVIGFTRLNSYLWLGKWTWFLKLYCYPNRPYDIDVVIKLPPGVA